MLPDDDDSPANDRRSRSESPLSSTRSPPRASRGHITPLSASPRQLTPQPSTSRELSAVPQPLNSPVLPTSNTKPRTNETPEATLCETEDPELSEDILLLLGDAPKEETPLGPTIHKDVASRWQEILAKGLSKEAKDKLLKDYLVPSNCDLLLAPTLNPEAKAAIPDSLVKRDSSLMYKQKLIGVALSALAVTTGLLLSNEKSKEKILKPLSDACRLLCDSHCTDTKTRRNFVISSINTNMKDTLIETTRDKMLFGENLSEKLKAAKCIQKSGESLKTHQKNVFHKSNFTAKSNKGRLNFKPLHRKTDQKQNAPPYAAAARAPRQPARAHPRRARERSPPPPPPRRNGRR